LEDNIKMDLRETGCERQMELAQKCPMVGPDISGDQPSRSTKKLKN
jgi:hypothetical protein